MVLPGNWLYLDDAAPVALWPGLGESGCPTCSQPCWGSVSVSLSALQVMKMIMTLNVQESGRVKYIKRPGAVLEAGCVVARLELDDPSKVRPVGDAAAHVPWLAQVCWGGSCTCSGRLLLLARQTVHPDGRSTRWPHPFCLVLLIALL